MKILSIIYSRIFKDKLSDRGSHFIKNLLIVSGGHGIFSICNIAFQIIIGRYLGPSEYGKYTLVYSTAMFLYVPMTFGTTTSMVKYNAEQNDYDRQTKIISASTFLISIFSLVSVIIILFFAQEVSKIFSISPEFLLFSLLLAFIYTLYIFSTGILRSTLKMKEFSFYNAIAGIVILSSLILAILLGNKSFKSGVFATYIAYGIVTIFIFLSHRNFFKWKIEKYWIKKLFGYSSFAIIGGIASAFYTNFDKIIINKYLNFTQVGIYRAYYTCFVSPFMFFCSIFNEVFFPTISGFVNKEGPFKKINRILPYFDIISVPFIILFGSLILKFYGKQYSFNPLLSILFAIFAITFFTNDIYAWLMSAVGLKGIKITSLAGTIRAIGIVILNLILIPLLGIIGSIIAGILSFLFSILIIFAKRKYYAKNEN